MSHHTSAAAARETLVVEGLNEAAEIRVDSWGIPHIRAKNKHDLFFLQGFNAARDRLWQIDLWRKRGLGLLAADFGPGYLAQDIASRAFLFRGDMAAEWTSYAPDTQEICDAFVQGINAYIGLTEREPDRLPVEYTVTKTWPARWQAADVVRIRSHALARNALSELHRARLISAHGVDTDRLRKTLEPAVDPDNPGGLDFSSIPLEILDMFKLATAGVSFSPERLSASLADAHHWSKLNDLAEVMHQTAMSGSNNWAVAGDRTDSGRPIMAGDPHRNHALPSLRYLVHLTMPGLDVIGAGEPCVPGISMGHNGTSAFTLTIFPADQEDVYVYETEPGNADRYRYDGAWENMQVVTETFAVKGEPDQVRQLRFTRHGPVVFADPEKRTAYGLRSVWFEPGTAAYLASLSTMRAKSLETFKSAVRRYAAPSLNHVYADTSGTIAWLPFGAIPVRQNWTGLLPVPGDGRFEWNGFLRLEDMPRSINPACGFVASANEHNLPADWDHSSRPVGFEWSDSSRARRIHEVLGGNQPHAIASSQALQTDTFSHPAKRLVALLCGVTARSDGTIVGATKLLSDWDCHLHASSGPAALFELWFAKHLKPTLFKLLVPQAHLRALLVPGDIEGILETLEHPDERFGADPRAARDRLLRDTLGAAYRDAVERLGAYPARWQWGQLHHGYFEHPLGPLMKPDAKAQYDIGPLAKGGGSATVMLASYRPKDFRVTIGASVRFVLDVGSWDASFCINAPGQSGDSRSTHYGDLAPLWASGTYVPFLYSEAAVNAATASIISLVPAR